MEKIHFTISINAPKEKVWNVLWNDASYRKWTSAFTEGSYAVTDNWKKGSKVLFLDPKGSGLVSEVVENRPGEYMSFRHIGEVKDGIEDTAGNQAWKGAMENYTLTETGNATDLTIDGDITQEFKEYFLKVWPKALEKVKALAEE